MADTLVDGVAASGTHDIGMFGPYWSNKDTAIIVFIDQSQDVSIRRTADAGATWSKTVVDAGTAEQMSSYFDKETPDDTGDVVHIAWSDSVAGSIFYRGFNVASNSFVAAKATVDGGITVGAATNERVSITKTRSSNLIVAFETGTEIGCVKSGDAFATAGTIIDDVFEGAGNIDTSLLLPANTGDSNDACAIYMDRSVDTTSIKMYDDSANLWTETIISSGMDVNVTGISMDAATRHSDGHILLSQHSNDDTATDDLRTWDLTPDSIASPGVSAKTDVLTDIAEAKRVAVLINQQTDDVYVAYTRGATQDATVDVFYKLSTNDMTSWGSETSYSEDTPDDLRIVHGGHSVGDDGGRIQFSFFNDDLNDIFVNETNDIQIDAAAVFLGSTLQMTNSGGMIGGMIV